MFTAWEEDVWIPRWFKDKRAFERLGGRVNRVGSSQHEDGGLDVCVNTRVCGPSNGQ